MMHLINRLQFEITCPGEELAFNLRHNFAPTFEKWIVEAVERTCSKFVKEEECIRIDKLEIDMGRFNAHSFDADFANVFLQQFEKKLCLKLSEIPFSQRETSRQFSEQELFLHFLQTGTLPWWAAESEVDINTIGLNLFLNGPGMLRQFFFTNRFREIVWRRSSLQLTDSVKMKIISLFEELSKAKSLFTVWIEQLSRNQKKIIGAETENPEELTHTLLLWNAPVIFKEPGNTEVVLQIFKNHLTAIFPGCKANSERINELLPELVKEKKHPEENFPGAKENINPANDISYDLVNENRYPSDVFTADGVNNEPNNNLLSDLVNKDNHPVDISRKNRTNVELISSMTDALNPIAQNPGTNSRDSKQIEKTTVGRSRKTETVFPGHNESPEEMPVKFKVAHSGIVLLAPFLKTFFSKLNLFEGTEWKSKEAQDRAVHLLKFLSTGEQKIPEYSLTLEKIFCGLAIKEPIALEVSLQENEIKEAELLLGSVIEHWKVLQNTSMKGMRETFLKREGLITRKEEGWLLQVERKTPDVLLESIPWGYSTIHLPWNSYLIFVEW